MRATAIRVQQLGSQDYSSKPPSSTASISRCTALYGHNTRRMVNPVPLDRLVRPVLPGVLRCPIDISHPRLIRRYPCRAAREAFGINDDRGSPNHYRAAHNSVLVPKPQTVPTQPRTGIRQPVDNSANRWPETWTSRHLFVRQHVDFASPFCPNHVDLASPFSKCLNTPSSQQVPDLTEISPGDLTTGHRPSKICIQTMY